MSIILTGDRPTGSLHLGHYVGSLQNRVALQKQFETYIIIADTQALTDYFEQPEIVRANVYALVEDYLACGIDPQDCCIFIQSTISALPELTMYYMNLVSVARLERNPTVKNELRQKSFANNVTCGFLCYPISQAADITAFKAELVPVGEDQLPMIEQTNEIVRKFNSVYSDVLVECKPMLGKSSKLLGIDGRAKASKSLNNCIFLNDDDATVKQKVMSMYTDPNHIRVSDPGKIEGNMVFHYLDAFWDQKEELEEMKAQYRKGGLGDVVIKQKLIAVLEEFFVPIRQRRSKVLKQDIRNILDAGCKKANDTALETLYQVKNAMNLIF